MFLKGLDKFREKTPMLKGIRILIVPIYLILIIFITSYVLEVISSFSETFYIIIPGLVVLYLPIIGFILIELTGFILLGQMWIWRDTLKNKWGPFSYQRILPIGLCGITIVIFLAFYNFRQFPLTSYSMSLTEKCFLSNKPLYIFFISPLKDIICNAQLLSGYLVLLLGLSLSFRSIYTFGIDYTTAIYLYFPEESAIQENRIYSVLRHPMYTGLLFICFAGFVINLTAYSFIYFIMYLLGFYIHIHFIEERELISRFGDSYKSYRKEVPFLFINPVKFLILLRFIIKG